MSQGNLRTTALHERHLAAGAKMADFGGWDMPIEYVGVLGEHAAVRNAVGIFDVSHMGKLDVRGPAAAQWLNSLLANDLDRIDNGQAQYSMLCNDHGGVIDDLIVYRWADDHVFIIPNASNADAVYEVLCASRPADMQVQNLHEDLGIIAIQGPASTAVLAVLDLPTEHAYMSMVQASFAGFSVTVCRTGYTGEHGYEIVAPTGALVALWDQLVAAAEEVAGMPAGLGARDTLRTEMGYPLHGQDISPEISPVTAGIAWAVGWEKPAFHGRQALLAERAAGPVRRLRAITALDRGIPRPHMHVHVSAIDGPVVGEVTSGTYSPTLKQGIGLALLDAAIQPGETVVVDVRGRPSKFLVTKAPLVQPSTK